MQFINNENYPNLFIREHTSDKYPPRTAINASSGDVTLALAVDMTTRGELLTKEMVLRSKKIYVGKVLEESITSHDVARDLYRALKQSGGNILNVAGNGIYTLKNYGCSQDFINLFVFSAIEKVHEHYPLSKIVTGGQTGVDMAGALAGVALGIHTEVTFPKGFIQRFAHSDVIQSPEEIFESFRIQLDNLKLNIDKNHTIIQSEKKPAI